MNSKNQFAVFATTQLQVPTKSAQTIQSGALAPGTFASLSSGTAEVEKLVQSGVGDGTVLSYFVQSKPYGNPSAADIVPLKNVRTSSEVITALIDHDGNQNNRQWATSSVTPAQPATPIRASSPLSTGTVVRDDVVSAENPRPEAIFFYDQLAPCGEWSWNNSYGWVWPPTDAAVDRRPYANGGRKYSNVGSTWISGEPWEWAAFHYGRWFIDSYRGCYWAPAWVAWHSDDDFCGLAPMPPRIALRTCSDWDAVISAHSWCFVEHRDVCAPHLRDHLALVARNGTPLAAARNITQLESRVGAIAKVGVTVEQIEKGTNQTVRRLYLSEVNSLDNAVLSSRTNVDLRMYRPVVQQAAIRTTLPRSETSLVAGSAMNFEELLRDEAALKISRHAELRTPLPGVSASQLMQSMQAEHLAFEENDNRQMQALSHHRSPSRFVSPQRSSKDRRNDHHNLCNRLNSI